MRNESMSEPCIWICQQRKDEVGIDCVTREAYSVFELLFQEGLCYFVENREVPGLPDHVTALEPSRECFLQGSQTVTH